MEQEQITKLALLGGAAYLLYQYLNSPVIQVAEPLTTIANGAGVTVSSQATAVQTAPVLPGVITAPPASGSITASALEQKAAENGYPSPQTFTVWQWNYFYGLITGSGALPDPTQVLPGVQNANGMQITAQQYASGMSKLGLPIGLGGASGRRYGASLGRVNNTLQRGAIQLRGMAPIHGWE